MKTTTIDSTHADDLPRSLQYADVLARRNAMLEAAHIAQLTDYVRQMRLLRPDVKVPFFDPLDGGIKSKVLFLLEKPGPMAAPTHPGARGGSGFISRNNNDPTAQATWNFMREADLPREQTVIWNVIPCWNGTTKVTITELREGVGGVGELVKLLPDLKVIVLVGNKAQTAKTLLDKLGFEIFCSYHPSPIVRAANLEKWRTIPSQWAKAKAYIDANP